MKTIKRSINMIDAEVGVSSAERYSSSSFLMKNIKWDADNIIQAGIPVWNYSSCLRVEYNVDLVRVTPRRTAGKRQTEKGHYELRFDGSNTKLLESA